MPGSPTQIVPEPVIGANSNGATAPEPEGPRDFRAAVALYERTLLEQALSTSRHNQRRAAGLLGLSYDQLRHCLKRHNLLAG